mmetsp:Transcript_28642/g.91782  ORF Transcript_28642/g.91782 Transcript_28642/m.91782 type:complete len:204 (-) Transcript_28642:301-912(-)
MSGSFAATCAITHAASPNAAALRPPPSRAAGSTPQTPYRPPRAPGRPVGHTWHQRRQRRRDSHRAGRGRPAGQSAAPAGVGSTDVRLPPGDGRAGPLAALAAARLRGCLGRVPLCRLICVRVGAAAVDGVLRDLPHEVPLQGHRRDDRHQLARQHRRGQGLPAPAPPDRLRHLCRRLLRRLRHRLLLPARDGQPRHGADRRGV